MADLGFAPPSNAYVSAADLSRPEKHFPLRVKVCEACWLVQTEDYANADELFSADYAYFSSTSAGWLAHARNYCAAMTKRLGLDGGSFVIEVASNDGYLLKNFVAAGIPCLGIEPTASTAAAAEAAGIPTRRAFFGAQLGKKLAAEGRKADLIIGNNVFAHVPDINDFSAGLAAALKPGGVVTLEFPHLLNLIRLCQFDTIYHEHYSYLSLATVSRILAGAGLRVFDVEALPTHGGSLRVFACLPAASHQETKNLTRIIAAERKAGLQKRSTYEAFQPRAEKIKDDVLRFLIDARRKGKRVVGYGAAAKGNTLLNFAGVRPDLLPFVCDAATSKQGRFMPGSHIPILPPEALRKAKADYVLVLPWNILPEVMQATRKLAGAKAKYVIAVPHLRKR